MYNHDIVGAMDVEVMHAPSEVKKILGTPEFEGMSEAGVTEYLVRL
jgi:hypothetical protein